MADGIPQIELRPLAGLIPYIRNARTHSPRQIEQIKASLLEFGWTNAVLADHAGIVAGHGRVMAASALYRDGQTIRFPGGAQIPTGMVPVVDCSGWSDAQRRAYILADNQLALSAGWDEDMLRVELADLQTDGFDLGLTGFEGAELSDLLAGVLDLGAPVVDPDDVPDAPAEPVSRIGDVWICGDHRIACMDSLSLAAWGNLMQGDVARLCVTDPPYNVNFEGAAGKIKNDNMADSEFRKFLHAAFAAMFQNMEPGAPLYVAHADTQGLNFRGALSDVGFKLSGCLIWCKQSLVLGRSDWQWRHEPILYLWRPGAAHRWYGGRKRTTILEYGDGNPFQRLADGRWAMSVGGQTLIVSGDAEIEEVPGSVIYHDKPSRSELHPTTKPTGLWRKLIEPSSRPGDIVIDPFSGSGTTLITCEMMGRCARVAELDEKFVDVGVIRWQMLTGRRAVHAKTGKDFPLQR